MLHVATIVIGLALIGASVAILKSVDAEIGLRVPKPMESFGLGTQPGVEIAPSRISEGSVQRLTILGSVVGLMGAMNLLIGAFQIAVVLLETKARPSRLGTDLKSRV